MRRQTNVNAELICHLFAELICHLFSDARCPSFNDLGTCLWPRGALAAGSFLPASGREAARFFAASGGARYLFWLPSIIGMARLGCLSCGLGFFARLRLRLRQLVQILASDVRLPAFINAGAFVQVALSVADFDFEPDSGATGPVL
jgi:hypothetical protein